jgi:hypothetical protein
MTHGRSLSGPGITADAGARLWRWQRASCGKCLVNVFTSGSISREVATYYAASETHRQTELSGHLRGGIIEVEQVEESELRVVQAGGFIGHHAHEDTIVAVMFLPLS